MSLPREYSQDLHPDSLGAPLMETDLEPGDLLYFPRGTIHYARTSEKDMSTHMTVSTYQATTWYDFMQRALPLVLEKAFSQEEELRKGLPVNLFSFMGNPHNYDKIPLESLSTSQSIVATNIDKQKNFVTHFKSLLKRLESVIDDATLHEASSDMALDFVANRTPPNSAVGMFYSFPFFLPLIVFSINRDG